MVTPIKFRYATDEDYAKRDFYTVSVLRRGAPKSKPKEDSKQDPVCKTDADKKLDSSSKLKSSNKT